MYSPQSQQYGSIIIHTNQFWIKQVKDLPKIQRSRLAAKSMKTQRGFLSHARKAIASGDTYNARKWLLWWETERAYHAHLLGHFDDVAL